MYPKDQILFYFTSVEPIIEGGLNTFMFDDSLLEYVDMFCDDYSKGNWKTDVFSMGTTNWYWEFKKYLKFKGIDVKWKVPEQPYPGT